MFTGTRWLGFVGMIFVLLAVPAMAAPPRGGASTTPKVHGSKATTPKASQPGAPVKASTTKVKGSSTKVAKSTQAGTATTASNTATSGSTTTSTGSTGATTTAATWTPDNPVAQKLSTKSNIMKKVQNVVGTDVDLNHATAGFKNFGQFVAAVNVSNNHQIAFADLKAAMTGIDLTGQPIPTTGTTGTSAVTTLSLGQAIQKLKTGVDGDTVAQTALTQADAEINSSPTTTKSK